MMNVNIRSLNAFLDIEFSLFHLVVFMSHGSFNDVIPFLH